MSSIVGMGGRGSVVRYLTVFLVALVTTGCGAGGEGTNEGLKRIAICEEVMRKYIVEAHLNERDWKKTIASCNLSQFHRTFEQWQCVLNEVNTGKSYVQASDQCGSTPVQEGLKNK
jgi:hypothetical protein